MQKKTSQASSRSKKATEKKSSKKWVAYGSLIAFAQQLGFQETVPLLQQTLQEEKAADAELTQLAQSRINLSAAQERKAA